MLLPRAAVGPGFVVVAALAGAAAPAPLRMPSGAGSSPPPRFAQIAGRPRPA